MAFGGMGGFGGGGPMFGGGGGRSAANPGGGLPFAGVPEEMRAGVEALLTDEPVHPEPAVGFDYAAADTPRVTLRGLLFRHARLGVLATLLVAILSITNQAGPALIGVAVDRGMLRAHRPVFVAGIALAYLASIGVAGLCQRWQVQVTGRLAARVMHDLRITVFIHLSRLGLDFYTEEKAGVVLTRMTSDIENLQQLLQDGLASMVVQALTMIVVAVALLVLNPTLAGVTIVLVVPALAALSLWFRSASEAAYARVRDGIAGVLTDLSESLQGVRTVIAYHRQQHNIGQHRRVVRSYQRANDATAQISAIYGPGSQLLGFLTQAVLLGIGGVLVEHRSLSIGSLIAFFLYVNRFFAPIQLLVQQYTSYQSAAASLVKLNDLLATRPTVRQAPDARPLPPVQGDLAFDRVSFGYDPARPVLHEVTLHIPAGQTVAFVGRTGAGKSTLAKLIPRFYDPDRGAIRLDGHDLREVTVESLRRQLGVVPQEPFLFAATLRDNLTFADPAADAPDTGGGSAATPSEAAREGRLQAAIDAVGLAPIIARLPDGLDTVVHERGQSLSSGERQLIALARAFLAQPRVLVLDEATSSLDLASEAAVEAALDALLRGRTAVLIAHRLSTAMKADRIVVLGDGKVLEDGSPGALIAAGGVFAGMYATWLSDSGLEAESDAA